MASRAMILPTFLKLEGPKVTLPAMRRLAIMAWDYATNLPGLPALLSSRHVLPTNCYLRLHAKTAEELGFLASYLLPRCQDRESSFHCSCTSGENGRVLLSLQVTYADGGGLRIDVNTLRDWTKLAGVLPALFLSKLRRRGQME